MVPRVSWKPKLKLLTHIQPFREYPLMQAVQVFAFVMHWLHGDAHCTHLL